MMDKYVFISYSSKDLSSVEKVLGVLERMKVPYWKAPERIPAGSSYAREIPAAIRNCEAFLLFVSASSQKSVWVEKEIDTAVWFHRRIIPIQLDLEPFNDTFRFYLNNVQMLPYCVNLPTSIAELKNLMDLLILSGSGKDEEEQEARRRRQREEPGIRSAPLKKAGPADRRRIFTNDPMPEYCRYCGGTLEKTDAGDCICQQCGKMNYDDLQTIRMFLEKNGPSSAVVIEQATGIRRNVINRYFRDEYLEIPQFSTVMRTCTQCGRAIRTGSLCDNCKLKPKTSSGIYVNEEYRGKWRSSGPR